MVSPPGNSHSSGLLSQFRATSGNSLATSVSSRFSILPQSISMSPGSAMGSMLWYLAMASAVALALFSGLV